MTSRKDIDWQSPELVKKFLDGVRAAIPQAGEQIDVMLRLLAALDRPVGNVLDLGCGDGILAAAILQRWPGANAVLLDFSADMLAAAQKRLGPSGSTLHYGSCDYSQKEWVRAAKSFAPFDAIVSGFSIHHQPDARKREIFGEIHELLSPGGIFINIDHVAPPTPWLLPVFTELFVDSIYAYHVRQKTGQTREETAEYYRQRSESHGNILAPLDMQIQWLREIGYVDVDCYAKIFEFAVFGGRRKY
jgi:tRNA (cmo5U34)-methyltransferase